MARHLAPYFDVAVFDETDRSREALSVGAEWRPFGEVAARGIVVFAVPIGAFARVLERASPVVRPDSLCIDVCSVKLEPVRLMLEHLAPTVEIIGTHPLFGPQSGSEGIAGLRIAVCPVRSARIDDVTNFLAERLGLRVFKRTPEEHDREMAHVQALTHFVARALDELHVEGSALATVSYEKLMRAARLVSDDSPELFRTIQQGNPFAAAKRKALIAKLVEIENRLENSP